MVNNYDGSSFLNTQFLPGEKSFTQNVNTSGYNDLGFKSDGLASSFGNILGSDGKGGILGMSKETLGGLGDLGGLAGGLASTYAGFKQLGLAEDAFNFNKAMKEKEYAMAKDAYDRNVARAKSVGDQMREGKVG